MKPGRLQNALKSFGRVQKCFKILRPDSKIHGILENVSSGLPKICKIYENPKNVIFFVLRSSRIRSQGWKDRFWTPFEKKMKRFCSQVSSSGWHFWIGPVLEVGEQPSVGKLGEIIVRYKNTWKSTKSIKSIKTNGNKWKQIKMNKNKQIKQIKWSPADSKML